MVHVLCKLHLYRDVIFYSSLENIIHMYNRNQTNGVKCQTILHQQEKMLRTVTHPIYHSHTQFFKRCFFFAENVLLDE